MFSRTIYLTSALAILVSATSTASLGIQTTAAETAPASKCVTATTSATHASVTARMETDIAPYANSPDAAAAIKKYRDGMTVAWDAMNEPYCGYGAYGTASAIKSYAKTVDRERTTFVTAVKGLAKAKTVSAAMTPPPAKTPVITAPSPEPTPAPATTHGRIPSGLYRGHHSAAVTLLQQLLTSHFHIVADDSNITGYFGPKTEGLVLKFQLEQHIVDSDNSPGAGMVGPKTSAALNRL